VTWLRCWFLRGGEWAGYRTLDGALRAWHGAATRRCGGGGHFSVLPAQRCRRCGTAYRRSLKKNTAAGKHFFLHSCLPARGAAVCGTRWLFYR